VRRSLDARWPAFWGLVLLVLATSAVAWAAPRIEDLEERLLAAESNFQEMHRIYLAQALLAESFALEARLQEGSMLLEVGQPERASVLFLDIVSRSEWRNEPGYGAALYLLGRSLYEAGYYQSARSALLRAVREGRPRERQDAAALLIETAIVTGNWEGVDEVYRFVEESSGGVLAPALLYARGKGLYREGRLDAALQTLLRLAPDSVDGLKAAYFVGVIRAQQGDLEAALAAFQSILQARELVRGPDASEVVELTFIAVARIHYEREAWSDALDSYQNVPRQSRFFDQALYEITWTHVREGNTLAALRNLDILMLSRPDSLFIPDAQRLSADLLKEGGDYARALDTYENLLDTFEPVMQELDNQVAGHEDKLSFFQQLVAEDAMGRAQYLPASAARWVNPDEEMRVASTMVSSLGRSWENTEDAVAIIEEIQAAIEGPRRYEMFAELRGGWVSAIELENVLLQLLRDLNEVESASLGPATPAREARIAAEAQLAKTPRTRDDFLQRERRLGVAMEERRLEAYRLRTQLEGAQAQLEVMRRWLLFDSKKADLAEDEVEALRAEVEGLQRLVSGLKDRVRRAETDLRMQASTGGVDMDLAKEEAALRESFKGALLVERQALAAMRGQANAGADLARVDRLVQQWQHLDASLESFRGQIVAIVDGRVSDIRRRLALEAALVEQARVRYDQLQGNVELVAGEIAYLHWKKVYALVVDLVLGADVGVVDVAWLQKEDVTRRVGELIRDANKDRDILEQDFQQILREFGQQEGKP